ncbi:MAG: hypothetical protein WAQ05_07615 [Rubrivivax sp.]
MPSDYPPAIAHADFTDPPIAPQVAQAKPLRVMRKAYKALGGNTVVQPVVELAAWKATAQGTQVSSRKSFDADPGAPIRSASREKRFHFAPDVETLDLKWKINGHARVTQLRFEVYERGVAVPLYTATLTFAGGACPQEGGFSWNGRLDQDPVCLVGTVGVVARATQYTPADYPGDTLCVTHAPYKFKLVVLDPAATLVRSTPARWVFADVLLGKPTLDWLPKNTLAASTALPTNALPPTPAVERDHQVYDALTDANDLQNLSGAVPAPGQRKRVYLQAHVFYRAVGELVANHAWSEWRQIWGEGPNIPLKLTPTLVGSDDATISGATAVRALGTVRFVWEWVDRAAPPPGDLHVVLPSSRAQPNDLSTSQAAAQSFVNQAQDFDRAATAPPGLNSHLARGGKRGPGAPAVFPVQGGGGPFPFAVAAPVAGNWTGVSSLATTGPHAGCTGVVFRPSILPGDAFQLRVAPVLAGLVDPTAVYTAFHQAMDDVPLTVRLDSGDFVVWKTVEHTVYNANPQGLQAAHCNAMSARFEKFFVRVRNTIAPVGQFTAARDALYNNTAPSAGQLELPLRIALAGAGAHNNAARAIWFKPWTSFRDDLVHHHGGAAQAHAWADAYAPAIADLWRNGRGVAPLAPVWPHAIASVVANGDPASTAVRITPVAGTFVGLQAVVTADANGVQGAVRAMVNALYFDFGSYRTHGPVLNLDVQCRLADQVAVTNAIAQGLIEGHEEALTSMYNYQLAYHWGFRALGLIFDDLVGQRDGLMTFQFEKPTNLDTGPAAKAGFASPSRASLYVYMLKTDEMEGTLCHEFGHAMFINHPYREQPANDPRELHDETMPLHCTMNTPAAQRNFCGLCMLRLRSWSIFELDAAGNPVARNPVPLPPADPHVRTLLKSGAQNTR